MESTSTWRPRVLWSPPLVVQVTPLSKGPPLRKSGQPSVMLKRKEEYSPTVIIYISFPEFPAQWFTVAARQLCKSAHFSEILTQVTFPSCYSFAKSHFPKTSRPFTLSLQPISLLRGSLSSPWLTSVSSYCRWNGFLSSCSLSSSSGKRLRFSF